MNHEAYSEQLSALLDGELPAAEMAALAAHLAMCPQCARSLAELAALRAALQQEFPVEEVAPDFLMKIANSLDSSVQPAMHPYTRAFRPRLVRQRLGWLTAGVAIAATLTMLLLPRDDVTKDLMSVRDAALRESLSQTNEVSHSIPVAAGFRLIASRSDIVAGHLAQVLSYAKDNQTITLCIWPANKEPAHGVRNAVYTGTAISYWNDGKQEYWAATSAPAGLLNDFVREIRNG